MKIPLDTKRKEYFQQEFTILDLANREVANKEFEACVFANCDFSNTSLKDCWFEDCEFNACNLSNLKVKGNSFANNKMKDTKAIGINWTEIDMPTVKIYNPVEFYNSNISHSIFIGMDLKEITITECQARNADFRDTDLSKSKLTHTDFLNSHFNNTNLTESDLSFAVNYDINIFNNIIKKAKFSLPEAVSLLSALDIHIDGADSENKD